MSKTGERWVADSPPARWTANKAIFEQTGAPWARWDFHRGVRELVREGFTHGDVANMLGLHIELVRAVLRDRGGPPDHTLPIYMQLILTELRARGVLFATNGEWFTE